MSEPTYTLDQAQVELQRRECEFRGHPPVLDITEAQDRTRRLLCTCGQWVYTASEAQRV